MRKREKGLLYFNIILVVCSLVCYISPKVSTASVPVFGFLGYMIPVVIVLNLIMIMIWLSGKRKFALISILVFLPGIYIYPLWYINLTTEEVPQSSFKVLSYNVRYFNVGDIDQPKAEEGVKAMFSAIENIMADIMCFQEYYNNPGSSFANTWAHLTNQGYIYHVKGNINIFNSNDAGLAIFSKYPIVNDGLVYFGEKHQNKSIFADIVIASDTIRIYNVHFASVKMVASDGLFERLSKINKGFDSRGVEVDILSSHIKGSPHPVILAGDFNDLPYSYAYDQFSLFMTISHEAAGSGLGITYSGKIPGLRIDHQFAHPEINVISHKVLRDINFTDHFPILAQYHMN